MSPNEPPPTHHSKVALLLVPAAAALAALLLLLRFHLEPPVVPPYRLYAAPAQDPIGVHAAEPIHIELRPSAPVTGAVAARAFLRRGSDVRPWNARWDASADGTLRVAGPGDVLFAGVPAGEWEMDVAVGRPETLPNAPMDIVRARSERGVEDDHAAWRLVYTGIRIGG